MSNRSSDGTFDNSPNLYEVLGLSSPATASRDAVNGQDIKTAYRQALLKWHPDKIAKGDTPNVPAAQARGNGHVAGERSGKAWTVDDITHAYEVLSNPKLKQEYDEFLAKRSRSQLNGHANHGKTTELEVLDLDDMEYDGDLERWTKQCRCGNQMGFHISEAELNEIVNDESGSRVLNQASTSLESGIRKEWLSGVVASTTRQFIGIGPLAIRMMNDIANHVAAQQPRDARSIFRTVHISLYLAASPHASEPSKIHTVELHRPYAQANDADDVKQESAPHSSVPKVKHKTMSQLKFHTRPPPPQGNVYEPPKDDNVSWATKLLELSEENSKMAINMEAGLYLRTGKQEQVFRNNITYHERLAEDATRRSQELVNNPSLAREEEDKWQKCGRNSDAMHWQSEVTKRTIIHKDNKTLDDMKKDKEAKERQG
ncbi:MAG: hypothetical protein Q9159_006836 [Coniocarpon cinnabarinum]